MRTFLIIAGCISLLTGFSSFSTVRNEQITIRSRKDPSPTFEEQILFYVNKYRESKSLPALQMNTVISEQALKHSEEMADKKLDFGHNGFTDRVRNMIAKLGTLRASAENVAYGELSAEEVVRLWIKSPGHRKNIEGNFTLTGIGTAKSKDGVTYFTQIFSVK